MPYLNYCSSAWASATQGRLRKLEKRLKNVHSFLGKESSFCLKDLLNKNDAILVFKAMNHILLQITCAQNLCWQKTATLIELEELPKTGSHFPWLIQTLDKIIFHLELPKCGMYFLTI